jgi:hypothetical protein
MQNNNWHGGTVMDTEKGLISLSLKTFTGISTQNS